MAGSWLRMSFSHEERTVDLGRRGSPLRNFVVAVLILAGLPTVVVVATLYSGAIYNVLNTKLIALSVKYHVSMEAIVISFVFSVLFATTLVLLRFPSGRNSFVQAVAILVGAEKSFYQKRESSILDSRHFLRLAPTEEEEDVSLRNLELRLDGMERLVGQINSAGAYQEYSDEVRDSAVSAVVSAISEEVKDGVRTKLSDKRIGELENASLSRLSNQVVALGLRANVSLFAGVSFCLVGLFILWMTLVDEAASAADVGASQQTWASFFLIYAPRLSLVLIIEIIGLFFLRLFRAALDEVRLVQNEITNVESKFIAMHLALSKSTGEIPKVVESLIQTERNMIIARGETTVELEKAKGSREVETRFLDTLVSMIKGRQQ